MRGRAGIAVITLAALGGGFFFATRSDERPRGVARRADEPAQGREPQTEPLSVPERASSTEVPPAREVLPVPEPAPVLGAPDEPEVGPLLPGARLRAVILRDGVPMAGMSLNVRALRSLRRSPDNLWGTGVDPRWKATSGRDGVAAIEDLPAHIPLEIAVFGEGQLLRRLSERYELEPGETRELEIQIGTGCTIRGIALTPEGMPVAGLAVWRTAARDSLETKLYTDRDELSALSRRTTDESGAFLIEDVGVGAWYVGLAPRETPEGPLLPLARLVEVELGEPWKDVVLGVHRELFVRGRVVGPEGEPADHAVVTERVTGVSGGAPGGEFLLGPLPPGKVELQAVRRGSGVEALSERVAAVAGDGGVVLSLRAAASISGRCLTADGEAKLAEVTLVPRTGQQAGDWRMRNGYGIEAFGFTVMPGTYHLHARDYFGNVGRLENVVVEAGETLRGLKIVLQPGALVNVRVDIGGARTEEPREPVQVRLVQNGIVVAEGTGVQAVLPGSVRAELCSIDPDALELRVIATQDVLAVVGSEVEAVFYLEGP